MAQARPRPFLDTNVLFSALYSQQGPSAAILRPILAAAVASGAGCLVSGNTRHFTPQVSGCAGIDIYTPAAYLALLRARGIVV
ncbi:MAG: hypothetical protein HYY05_06125 [Chloroflexi bacterium]|nr:hypothetical protein [Chloroflexota bacterium]